MKIYLIKSHSKRSIRLWFRQNRLLNIKRSSIYLIDNTLYLIVKSAHLDVIHHSNLSILDFNSCSILEQRIIAWGSSEIDQNTQFIQFESDSILGNNGRILKYNDITITRTFDHLAELVAVLNYNHNSFSDGGKYNKPELAYSRILEQLSLGASVIDIGVESTRYVGTVHSVEHEIKQLKTILPEIIKLKQQHNFLISIDTYHIGTVEYLLNLDIDIINDVSGILPLELVKECISNNKQYIGTHSLTIPTDKSIYIDLKLDPIKVIHDWMNNLIDKMDSLGINLSQVIFDPGIGFGKNATQDWFILNNITRFYDIPNEILIGHSRKWFHSHILDIPVHERDLPTSLIAANLIKHIDYIRMHDLNNLQLFNRVIHELNK